MKDGFIKCAAASVKTVPCDIKDNAERIIEKYTSLASQGVKLIAFPELCVSGCSCGDFFNSSILLSETEDAVLKIAESSEGLNSIAVIGFPLKCNRSLYNCSAVIYNGEILGINAKNRIAKNGQNGEIRTFSPAMNHDSIYYSSNKLGDFCLNSHVVYQCEELPSFSFGIEIGDDMMLSNPPSALLASEGANIIVNIASGNETVGKSRFINDCLKVCSSKLNIGYIYCSSGEGESSSLSSFGGNCMVYEKGKLLCCSNPFEFKDIITEIDCEALSAGLSEDLSQNDSCDVVYYSMSLEDTELSRRFSPYPFVPEIDKDERWQEIIDIQSNGLKRRIEQTNMKPVLNVSGGLDSTLALIVCIEAMKKLGRPASDVVTITSPCFGTTSRTKNNAEITATGLGTDFRCIDIGNAVTNHLKDIGHSGIKQDAAFENAQARERTQIAMDVANMVNGFMIGTGDMSELALGWCTYNGDHMSMYAVNSGVPKSIMKYIICYYADNFVSNDVKTALYDICKTPISPELLPPKKGEIAQKTEDINGPYEIHDFILYYTVRYGFTPFKIYRLATNAFANIHDDATIRRTFGVFYRRFISQQFKRSCSPDSPRIGSVSLSAANGFAFPSDVCSSIWGEQAEMIANSTYNTNYNRR